MELLPVVVPPNYYYECPSEYKQVVKTVFTFVRPMDKDEHILQALHVPIKCKDYANEMLFANRNPDVFSYFLDIYDFRYDARKYPFNLDQVDIVVYGHKNYISALQKNIPKLTQVSTSMGLDSVFCMPVNGAAVMEWTKTSNSTSPIYKHAIRIRASKRWMTSTQSLSLFLYLVRLFSHKVNIDTPTLEKALTYADQKFELGTADNTFAGVLLQYYKLHWGKDLIENYIFDPDIVKEAFEKDDPSNNSCEYHDTTGIVDTLRTVSDILSEYTVTDVDDLLNRGPIEYKQHYKFYAHQVYAKHILGV